MSILKDLNWRYATKRMNGKKIPQQKIESILEAVRLAPTSYGMQAYKVLVIENPKLRQQIYEKACHQYQVLEASHLLVFAANLKITTEIADNYISLIAKERNVTLDSLADFRSGMQGFINDSAEKNFTWTANLHCAWDSTYRSSYTKSRYYSYRRLQT
jgi:nitroreductase / dihydropteridine reductase